ncbi:MAG: arsenate reductase (glutaredoxin) [Actinobacteria bacterium]|nr:arsenate reductase (glutaredoxin) [Actinomycetota bacterium]
MEIWHNPRCSKSRETLSLLEDAGVEPTVRRYLDDAPSVAELDDALTRLGLQPWDIARTKEPVAEELGIADWDHDRRRWLEAMVEHPVLIERPIVLTDDGRAALGRPPGAVLDLLP